MKHSERLHSKLQLADSTELLTLWQSYGMSDNGSATLYYHIDDEMFILLPDGNLQLRLAFESTNRVIFIENITKYEVDSTDLYNLCQTKKL